MRTCRSCAKSIEELGGEILFLTPAKMLVQDDSGKVTGVIAESDEKGTIQINAKDGVIVCTGGYGANDEMLQDLCPGNSNWCALRDSITEEGDGIRMALWAGAELEAGGACMIWNRAILPDGFTFDGSYQGGDIFLPGSQPFLHVNANGERFMNEDQCYPMSYAGGANQPGHFSWIVWDGSYWEDIQQFDTCGCSRLAPAPSGTAFNADVYDCEAITKEHLDSFWLEPRIENGSLKKCDTLDELAEAMGFDADQAATFKANVERYNELVAAGQDTDFGKPAYRMSAVDEPPFYAARIAGELGDHPRRHHRHGVPSAAQGRQRDRRPVRVRQRPGRLLPAQLPQQLHGHQRRPHRHVRPHSRQARAGREVAGE